MSLEPRGIIRDQIHGFIQINRLEYQLIQHPFLRRLHGVKQLGMAHLVFPGASHTRFNHSLGTMHVAGKMSEVAVRQARRGELCGYFFRHCDKGVDEFIEVARLAGLLHDIGHPPLSHQVENSLVLVARKKMMMSNAYSLVAELVNKYGGSFHEAFTKHFLHEMEKWYEDRGMSTIASYLRAAAAVLGAGEPETLEELGISSEAATILSSMISGQVFDADRLDYLVRDALMSGVVFGNIDIERLILGLQLELAVDEKTGEKRVVLGVHPRSLQTLEDMFDARYKMFKTVYYHHKLISINVAITRVVELLIDHWEEVAPSPLQRGLDGPDDLYRPDKIASLILNGYTLYTDSDFDHVLFNMASSNDKLLRRWANALLSDRWLLPISIAKRPDTLVTDAAMRAGVLDPKSDIDDLLNIIIFIHNSDKVIQNRFKELIYKIIKNEISNVSEDDIIVEVQSERIVKNDKAVEASLSLRSLYLYFIGKVGRLILLYPYVYSDSIDVHRVLYKRRNDLRNIFRKVIEDIMLEFSHS